MRRLTEDSNRLTKKQRLFQRQQEFYNRGSSVTSIPEYNALHDQHSLQYFLKNPVNKNLKKFLQAVNLQPQTQQKVQTIKSLNYLLSLNYNKKKKNLATLSTEKEYAQKLNSKRRYTEISNFNEIDKNKVNQKSFTNPYQKVSRPSILEKKNKFRLQILKRKEKSFKQKFMDENVLKPIQKQKRKPRKYAELESLNFQRSSVAIISSKPKDKQKYVDSHSFLKFISQKKQKIQQKIEQDEYKIDEFEV